MTANLKMLLCLQENHTVLAPQLLVLLLQLDDVVLGDGELHAQGQCDQAHPAVKAPNYNVSHSPPL